MFLLLEAVLDTLTTAIPPDQPLDHVDERSPVHLLIVGITRRHIRVVRLENDGFAGVYLPFLRFLLAFLNFFFALDVRQQPRERHPFAWFTVHVLELPLAAQLRPHC